MTRETAIEILKELWRTKYPLYLESDIRKALEMAINALTQECVEPTQKHIGNALDMRCEEAISQAKTGYWIEEDMFDGDVAYRCSECNELIWIEYGTPKDNGFNFCPKCGKRLVEPQERSEE